MQYFIGWIQWHLPARGVLFSIADGVVLLLMVTALWGVHTAPKGKFFVPSLNLRQGVALRGFFACVVVLGHLADKCPDEGVLFPRLAYWNALSVSVFFGLSGYGLMTQFKGSETYLDSFWKRRLGKLLIPYAILTLLAFGQWIRGDFSLGERAKEQLGIVQYGWYCAMLLLFYWIFWMSHRKRKEWPNEQFWLCVLGVLLASGVLVVSRREYVHLYINNGAFLVGLAIGKTDTFRNMLQKHWTGMAGFVLVFFILFPLLRLWLHFPIPTVMSQCRFILILNGLGFLCVMGLSMKWQLGNRILGWLGTISYELYLVHGWVMDEIRHWWPEWTGSGYIISVVAGSMAMAWMLHKSLARWKRGREASRGGAFFSLPTNTNYELSQTGEQPRSTKQLHPKA